MTMLREEAYQAARLGHDIKAKVLKRKVDINLYRSAFPDFPFEFVYLGKRAVMSQRSEIVEIYNKRDFKLRPNGWKIFRFENGWLIESNTKKISMILRNDRRCPSLAYALYYEGIVYDCKENKVFAGDWQVMESDFERPEVIEECIHKTLRVHTSAESFPKHPDFKYCYVCKKEYHKLRFHPGYRELCESCGKFNILKRDTTANLDGLVAVVTGGRQKIGYKTALKLLRCGATVISTTRYPAAARYNYLLEPDHGQWIDRLTIIKCDFRNRDDLYNLIEELKQLKPHILINNACQTVRPTKKYHDSITGLESRLSNLIEGTKRLLITDIEQSKLDVAFMSRTEGLGIKLNEYNDVDEDVSIREESAWRKTLDNIETDEILEVMLINQFAPTLIIQKVQPFMRGPKFIINVTAIEGSFTKGKEGGHHVHTNMCKAALNMLTRTLVEENDPEQWIYAVDPGFVSGVNILTESFPLKGEDAAARILDPIVCYYNGSPLPRGPNAWLWKDYKIVTEI